MVSLQLRDLGARYGRQTVFSGITTPELAGGQLIALLGRNGAGKSTLFRRIFGLLRGPGEVRITGAATPRPLAYMPQDSGARPVLTVYESILLGRMQGRGLRVSPADHAGAERVLAMLDIAHLRDRNMGDLSGGQRQMVGAAQALVQEPQILMMDEPTSALDLCRQMDLLRLLRRLTRDQGLLIILALHDVGHALRFADSVLVIDQGCLAACGPTAEIVTAGLLRDVFKVDARIEPCSLGRPQLIIN